ncbi:hypothetical protein [Demequina lignilytica]|uniref:DUF1648 domain-containing protein n=1 Tax=Demequina lignilytica TaxID=3051663 RepID=A0AB35MFA0_9MICO|nr:hypothetical protein [Demequina sp. SYSU T0a273]MDN4482458.1 hypothetical protein [Demequina sp. SYSU T0a273]
MSVPRDTAASRAIAVGVIAPLAVAATAVVVQLLMLGDLPDPVATHWGPSGVDGFAPSWTVPLMTALLAGGLPLLMAAIAVPPIRAGERGFVLRLLIAMAVGLSAFLAVILTGSLVLQRGLEDAADAGSVLPVVAVAVPIGLAVGGAGWLLQPRHAAAPAEATPVAPLERRPGERTMWFGRAEMAPLPLGALLGATVLLGVLALVIGLTSDPVAAWILAGTAVLIGTLVATLTVFRVRVDASGLTVRSAAGLVRMGVPASDVAGVAVTEVKGLSQYGGFGIRSVPGATAVVLRSGAALEVARVSGRRFVVTLDDAGGAAAVLAAVAEDARAAQD